MIPIEKNVIVVDEQGNILEATYPKRAKGLVKKGRARFIKESMICLACPSDKTEENEMSDTQNKFDNLEILIDNYVSEHEVVTSLKEELLSAIKHEKFLPAVEFAVKENKIGIAPLQRALKIGFAKAAYMIDAMEALGLISPPGVANARKVLPKAKEFLAYKSK